MCDELRNRPEMRRARRLGLALLAVALALRWLAFRYPDDVESIYGNSLYPDIALELGRLNGLVPFSFAELLLGVLLIGALLYARSVIRAGWRRLPAEAFNLAGAAGVVFFLFLLLWGFNYARPTLAVKLQLQTSDVSARELLAAGERSARLARSLNASLGASPDAPTRLPLTFAELDRALDAELRKLDLPGHAFARPSSPAKRLWLSPAISYLGISGIFIPFTGEPSINRLLPDSAMPLVVGHEKAHQLGVANEGEASLAAFMACAAAEDAPYLRYAAFLDAASELLGAAARTRPDDARKALESLGPGALKDLAAQREFWARYRGPLARGAARVNDAYLKSFRVRGGVESYAEIVRLLIALDRAGRMGS